MPLSLSGVAIFGDYSSELLLQVYKIWCLYILNVHTLRTSIAILYIYISLYILDICVYIYIMCTHIILSGHLWSAFCTLTVWLYRPKRVRLKIAVSLYVSGVCTCVCLHVVVLMRVYDWVAVLVVCVCVCVFALAVHYCLLLELSTCNNCKMSVSINCDDWIELMEGDMDTTVGGHGKRKKERQRQWQGGIRARGRETKRARHSGRESVYSVQQEWQRNQE